MINGRVRINIDLSHQEAPTLTWRNHPKNSPSRKMCYANSPRYTVDISTFNYGCSYDDGRTSYVLNVRERHGRLRIADRDIIVRGFVELRDRDRASGDIIPTFRRALEVIAHGLAHLDYLCPAGCHRARGEIIFTKGSHIPSALTWIGWLGPHDYEAVCRASRVLLLPGCIVPYQETGRIVLPILGPLR